MKTLDMTKVLSAEYLIGLCISLAAAYAAFSAWQSDANAKIIYLEKAAAISQADHDTLIRLQSDIAAIKEDVREIKEAVKPKKEAAVGGP